MFVEELVQSNKKEYTEAPHYWPFVIQSTPDRRILPTKG